MLLQKHHITDLYVLVDNLVAETPKPKGGRPQLLKDSEIVTILIWGSLMTKQKTLKDIYDWISVYHEKEFRQLPKYKAFVCHCHRAIPGLVYVLEQLLAKNAKVRIIDSTMIEVCKLQRASSYKVTKEADFGRNHQGWHFGFKLHASIDGKGRLCGLSLTPASYHDAQEMERILNKETEIAVGDGAYNASVMRERIWKKYKALVIAPPHWKQKKKISTWWQMMLLKARPKIEAVFDILKEHLGLVTSFPRSFKGYVLHYLRIVLGYQMGVGF